MVDDGYRPPEGFMTMAQAQARLGVSKPTLSRMVHRGELETFRDPRNRRVRLVKIDAVDQLTRPISISLEVEQGNAAA